MGDGQGPVLFLSIHVLYWSNHHTPACLSSRHLTVGCSDFQLYFRIFSKVFLEVRDTHDTCKCWIPCYDTAHIPCDDANALAIFSPAPNHMASDHTCTCGAEHMTESSRLASGRTQHSRHSELIHTSRKATEMNSDRRNDGYSGKRMREECIAK